MRIEFEKHEDGRNYLLIEDSNKPIPSYLERFSSLLEAGLALRYLSGLPMMDSERQRALLILEGI